MKITFAKTILLLIFISFISCDKNETIEKKSIVKYTISFENAVHHEAEVNITFADISADTFAFRMPRSSPGRYAIHEFAKNVYNVKATNSKGDNLEITRQNPYEWLVEKHDGTVIVSYTIFANRGGGTYAQVDETHAHLNIPATFMFAKSHVENPIEITFHPRKDLDWKVATQLKKESEDTYSAPNFQYFMDSPTEISNHQIRSFDVDKQQINFVLHHNGTAAELEEYFEKIKKIVLQEKAVFGELPKFDFNEYTFLACYIPNASDDGMEHRNSTILTSTRSLANGGMERNIGTVSHEFFHAWNVERIRPQSLEPFNFEEANMSGELWFAEGFTNYYTNLILCRAAIIADEAYINGLNGTFNHVWNSPARHFFNPIEMSYQAPFVDAATSVDPVNRENTFISYYSYGNVLGLALDLSLRQQDKNLDDLMKLVWQTYGKKEIPYTIKNLNDALNEFAGAEFGNQFFDNYIYKSEMPDYKTLFASVGISIEQKETKSDFEFILNGVNISRNPKIGSSVYKAGLQKGDTILSINSTSTKNGAEISSALKNNAVGDEIAISFKRYGVQKTTKLILQKEETYLISTIEKENLSSEIFKNRKNWLSAK
jgi:predicted metalloprotease with PDZ domain